jgi:hypothetical protein
MDAARSAAQHLQGSGHWDISESKYGMLGMKLVQAMILCAAIGLGSAAPAAAQQAASTPATGDATPQQHWEGKWEGTWTGFADGPCSGGIEVSEVTATSANVLYSWGDCGSSVPGSARDRDAKIEGDTLTLRPFRNLEMVFTHVDANTLQGNYTQRERVNATGTFTRQ